MDIHIDAFPPESLLAERSREIDDIQTASAFPKEQFDAFFLPLLRHYAAYVQAMPLTKDAYGTEYGALEFGLQASLISLRVAASKVFFHDLPQEERRILVRQCRFAVFAAALSTGIVLLAQHTNVVAGDVHYHPIISQGSLFQFLKEHGEQSQPTFTWRLPATPMSAAEAAAVAARFIPAGTLRDFDIRVCMMLFGGIAPQDNASGIESLLASVVRNSVKRLFEHNIAENAKRVGMLQPGAAAPIDDKFLVGEVDDGLAKATDNTPPAQNQAVTADPARASAGKPAMTPKAQQTNPAQGSLLPEPSVDSGSTTNSASVGSQTLDAWLAKATPPFREFLQHIKTHEKYAEFARDKVRKTSEGIELDIVALGTFGVKAVKVRTWFNDCGMEIGKSSDKRSIIVPLALGPLFLSA